MNSDICVYGLGYIGLPTAAIFANNGYRVTGYDVDDRVLANLRANEIEFDEADLGDLVRRSLDSGTLQVSDEPVPARNHLICVPTPLDHESRTADLDSVIAAAREIATRLRPADTVVLESTVPPGTTSGVVRSELEASGLHAGEDFNLAYCPETVLPGNILTELRHNERIVGGIDRESATVARELYDAFVEARIYETDATTAEMAKLSQNTYRDAGIALANELAKISRENGVDSGEMIRLANTHPRVDLHRPGPGVGGHCVPIDPWFLVESATDTEFIEVGRRVNDGMPEYVVSMLAEELGSLEGRAVGVLGIAYKGNVSDARESPGLRIVERLEAAGATVLVNDDHVHDPPVSTIAIAEVFERSEGIILATDHDEYARLSPEQILRSSDPTVLGDGSGRVIVDAKRVLDAAEWGRHGYRIVRL